MDAFEDTPAGPVPRVAARLVARDHAGTVLARLGLTRDRYKVVPGLYCVGSPDADSPVLVTANYKLSFDALRAELDGVDAWLLVADTHGINVWCAAGKGVLSTEEVARSVRDSRLAEVVSHRRLILPQLCANGVAAHRLRGLCGFAGEFGPVLASDLSAYLEGRAGQGERRVTFSLAQRAVLAPVEIVLLRKVLLWLVVGAFLLSGLGPGVFSVSAAWWRGLWALAATGAGVLAGGVAVPLLLPWLPARAFAAKGAVAGAVAGLGLAWASGAGWAGGAALALWTVAVASYMGMNFTGSTPFTSPTGVEYEMRRAIPAQAAVVLVAAVLWVASAWAA